MRIRYVVYSGVTKKWRKRMLKDSFTRNKWVRKYAIEILDGILVIKESNMSRLVNYAQLIKTKVTKLYYPLL